MVSVNVSEIDWDEGNQMKCQKHGVSIEEIDFLLKSEEIRILNDEKHSNLEKRYIAVGKTFTARHLFIAFTFRVNKGTILIRPISARYMHQKEVLVYEQETS